jgi:tRNA1Val (adenine37-N6)-methyltransferase
LLGAWVNVDQCHTILEVGTGTGVIALMLAQRSTATIMAIEPDTEAIALASENLKTSPFTNPMQVMQSTFQEFSTSRLFDLIVCNPPYFENSLKPQTIARQNQRHTDILPFQVLITQSLQYLQANGVLAVVLPWHEGNRFKEIAAAHHLHLIRSCAVTSKHGKPQERWLFEFSREEKPQQQETLTIMDETGQWTHAYQQLTRDFYLKF